MSSNNAYVTAITDELTRAGITEFVFEHGGKHPRVVYHHDGIRKMYVFPQSPSDSRRGVLNMLADLRRQIGVTAVRRKSNRPAKKRCKAPDVAPDTITVASDPFLALAAWKPKPPPSRFTWTRTGAREWRVEIAPRP